MNKVFLTGRLGSDPTSGNGVSRISLATSERWKDKNGEPQERTEWHRVVFFGKLAEIANQYLAKGRQILIEGKLHYDKYTDKDGIEKYSTDIIAEKLEFLGTKQDSQSGNSSSGAHRQTTAHDYRAAKDGTRPPPQDDFVDDDIPFDWPPATIRNHHESTYQMGRCGLAATANRSSGVKADRP